MEDTLGDNVAKLNNRILESHYTECQDFIRQLYEYLPTSYITFRRKEKQEMPSYARLLKHEVVDRAIETDCVVNAASDISPPVFSSNEVDNLTEDNTLITNDKSNHLSQLIASAGHIADSNIFSQVQETRLLRADKGLHISQIVKPITTSFQLSSNYSESNLSDVITPNSNNLSMNGTVERSAIVVNGNNNVSVKKEKCDENMCSSYESDVEIIPLEPAKIYHIESTSQEIAQRLLTPLTDQFDNLDSPVKQVFAPKRKIQTKIFDAKRMKCDKVNNINNANETVVVRHNFKPVEIENRKYVTIRRPIAIKRIPTNVNFEEYNIEDASQPSTAFLLSKDNSIFISSQLNYHMNANGSVSLASVEKKSTADEKHVTEHQQNENSDKNSAKNIPVRELTAMQPLLPNANTIFFLNFVDIVNCKYRTNVKANHQQHFQTKLKFNNNGFHRVFVNDESTRVIMQLTNNEWRCVIDIMKQIGHFIYKFKSSEPKLSVLHKCLYYLFKTVPNFSHIFLSYYESNYANVLTNIEYPYKHRDQNVSSAINPYVLQNMKIFKQRQKAVQLHLENLEN